MMVIKSKHVRAVLTQILILFLKQFSCASIGKLKKNFDNIKMHGTTAEIKYIYIYLSPWPYSASELYRQSGRRRSAKLVPAFADRGVSRGQRNGSPQ